MLQILNFYPSQYPTDLYTVNMLFFQICDLPHVPKHEVDRHIYATNLRNAHVQLDSVSKMRVKLAVQTLRQ